VSALLMVAAEDAPIVLGPEHQLRSCGRHRPFATAREAWLHYIAQLIANKTDPGQTVFRCACGFFHHGGGIRSLGRLLSESGWTDDVH
jgi:hypothetical protein